MAGNNGSFSKITGNSLDSTDNPTYHFRLFMGTERNISVIPPVRTDLTETSGVDELILLAETGATAMSMDNIRIDTIPTPSPETKSGTSTKMSFDITEPNSATFMDKMLSAGIKLGVDNFQKCVYYVELTFVGRTVATSVPSLLNKRWLYPIVITKMEISVNSSGASYATEGVIIGDIGYGDQYGSLPGIWNNEKAIDNVRDAFKEFEEWINPRLPKRDKDGHLNKSLHMNRYYIHLDSKLTDSKLTFASNDEMKDRNITNLSFIKEDMAGTSKMLSFANGTAVTDVIDSIMSISNMFEKKEEETTISCPNGKSVAGDPIVSFVPLYKIHSKVCSINSDINLPLTCAGDATSAVVKAFDADFKKAVKPNPDTGDYSKCIIYYVTPYSTPTLHNAFDAPAITPSAKLGEISDNIVKRYDYIFTGLNTQVKNFNLIFNTAFLQPFYKKLTANDQAINHQAELLETYEASEDPNKALAIAKKCEGADITPSKKQSTMDKYALEGDAAGSRTFLSSMMAQAQQQGSVNGDLLNVTLEIKGDPSWLTGGLTSDAAIFNKLALKPSEESAPVPRPFEFAPMSGNGAAVSAEYAEADFIDGVPAVIFRAMPALDFDDETGLYKSAITQERSKSLINGVYYVMRVSHSFTNGEFSQELECIRENRVNGITVENELNKNI